MKTVGLVGPDGAGKSTIARELVRSLPVPARYLYMGVNLEASERMLPTTRLALALRGSRRHRSTSLGPADLAMRAAYPRRLLSKGYSAVRLLAWLAEEWYRALLAMAYTRRGYLVVFDRHFLYDYCASHVTRSPGGVSARLHARLLVRYYPRPDLLIYLDAPADVLYARKGEHSIEALERQRRGYLGLAGMARDFAVVDTAQPLRDVVAEIRAMIESRLASPG